MSSKTWGSCTVLALYRPYFLDLILVTIILYIYLMKYCFYGGLNKGPRWHGNPKWTSRFPDSHVVRLGHLIMSRSIIKVAEYRVLRGQQSADLSRQRTTPLTEKLDQWPQKLSNLLFIFILLTWWFILMGRQVLNQAYISMIKRNLANIQDYFYILPFIY